MSERISPKQLARVRGAGRSGMADTGRRARLRRNQYERFCCRFAAGAAS